MLKRLPLKFKLLLIAVLPLFCTLLLTYGYFRIQTDNLNRAYGLREDLHLADEILHLLSTLDDERQSAVMYSIDQSAANFSALLNSYEATDAALVKTIEKSKGHADMHDFSFLDVKLKALRLNSHDKPGEKNISSDRYNIILDETIDIIQDVLREANDQESINAISDFLAVLHIDERCKLQEITVLKSSSLTNESSLVFGIILNDYDFIQNHLIALENSGSDKLVKKLENELRISEYNLYEALMKTLQLGNIKSISDSFSADYKMRIKLQKNAFHNAAEFQIDIISEIFDQAYNKSRQSVILIAVFMLIMISVLILILYLIYKDITESIKGLRSGFSQLATGDTTAQVNIISQDEFGELAKSFEILRTSTEKLAHAASIIGKGDYQTQLEVRGDKDLLGNALFQMKSDLQQLAIERDRRNWQLSGYALFSELAQTHQDREEFTNAVLSSLASYCNIQQAIFYVKDKTENDVRLVLKSSYAFDKRKLLQSTIKPGEGLVGQVLVEKKRIILENAPPDYISINSGLGNTLPVNILVLPLVSDKEVKGVIEMAAMHSFEPWEVDFFDKLAENIASALSLIEARLETDLLLQQTQEANERLKAQEEELRVTNEELAEQALVIKQSEEELRVQQEELMQSNIQLEEKTALLEEQNESVQTKNKELESAREAIIVKAQELETASRYKSEFLANMSHELRTPLNSMLILSNLLAENKSNNLSPEQTEYARVINKSGNDLLNLINDILDLSKIESRKIDLQIESFTLTELRNDVDSLFDSVASEKNIDFQINILPGLPESIKTDRFRLEQIIRNLMSNAFKFTPKGGKVILDIFPAPPEHGLVSRHLLNSKVNIGFAVKDSGIGIPEEKRQLIFEAFKQADGTTNRKYGGTGLGLSISRELALILGGEIRLESIVNVGSTFTLILPQIFPDLNSDNSELIEIPAISEPIVLPTTELISSPSLTDDEMLHSFSFTDDSATLTLGEKSLLIIEDDEVFASILTSFAREKGFKVILADRGDSGLQMAIKYKPHAIVLDIGLPVMDGWTVMKKLKQHPDTHHIPVHVITGNENKAKGINLGAVEYLTKPVSDKKLREVFNSLNKNVEDNTSRVLVIEDNKNHQDAVQALLLKNGITPLKAYTGKQAIEILESEKVDVIILDLNLPDISGKELLEKIKADPRFTSIPLIVYTGKELSREDNALLLQYSNTVVSKKARSNERLLDEISLFIRKVGQVVKPHEQNFVTPRPYESGEELKGKKVLLTDDDMRNIFALEKVLESVEISVVIANDGKDALDKLAQNSDIDLVLMDIMMPVMDGYEAIKEIRKLVKYKNLPIIALTAKAMKGDRDKCLEAGASDYLAKPIDNQKLLSLMRVWLNK